ELLRLAAAAEQGSEHPLGEAIVESAKGRNLDLPKVVDFTAVSGFGIVAKIEGENIYLGNSKWMQEQTINLGEFEGQAQALAAQGKTP
ncbi:heavy metal translocating P-type ATPase, partial [Streptococcus pyogenes]